jgi:threonyl-tRNA synthetase
MLKNIVITTSALFAGMSIWWAIKYINMCQSNPEINEEIEAKATKKLYEPEKGAEAKKNDKNKRKEVNKDIAHKKSPKKSKEILKPSNEKEVTQPTEETTGARKMRMEAEKLSEINQEGVQSTSINIVTPKDSKEDRTLLIEEQMKTWKMMKTKADEELKGKELKKISITLPDGKIIKGQSWRTTPYEVACTISKKVADATVVSKVNGSLWDLDRPLEADCSLKFLMFEDKEAEKVFWHSTAHILGQSLERLYGGKINNCPPIYEDDKNYYYETYLKNKKVSKTEYTEIERMMFSIVKERQPFERLEINKEDLFELFKHDEFKVRILNEKIKSPTTTVYRCGSLINLCMGPHVRHTGKINAFRITHNSSSYWEGNREAESFQRVYGISFPDLKHLKEWEKKQNEAATRDHRRIGTMQDLYFFHDSSPGSCFFKPHGAFIYNTLIKFIRELYSETGFEEVITPNIFNTKLWEESGHWQKYSENMFSFAIEKDLVALKPMNCPSHIIIFKNSSKSWRDLPLRLADFGVLHRNEYSGSLKGLLRVRRFQQDDAHIFCTMDQVRSEIKGALEFIKRVYSVLGFTFKLRLSTRPDNFLGSIEKWNKAEKELAECLNAFGIPWKEDPGNGAFYGPKIDITICDALERPHQCATIQLDFELPVRFNLKYIDENGQEETPVIIHRAVLGSIERIIAVLAESYAGRWPFWLSPRQCVVIPVDPIFDNYAVEVARKIKSAGFRCNPDTRKDQLKKKVCQAELSQHNFILVVGEKEKTSGTVNVRNRDTKILGKMSVDEVVTLFSRLTKERLMDSNVLIVKENIKNNTVDTRCVCPSHLSCCSFILSSIVNLTFRLWRSLELEILSWKVIPAMRRRDLVSKAARRR